MVREVRTYREDRRWSDRFIPQIKAIMSKAGWAILNIDTACEEDDNKRAIDITLKVDTAKVACRIRGPEYRTYNDFTIRARRKNGVMTELEKLRKRTVRYYLYCYADESESNIADWYIIDIFKVLDLNLLEATAGEKENKDGVTSFLHISLDELARSNCIIANGRGCP